MALIMYFTRAPRCEGVDAKDIQLIESYLNWQHEIKIGSKYASETFEKWCGHSETELPDINIVTYYNEFFNTRTGLFEKLARVAKQNHILNWAIKNVMNNKLDNSYYEITEIQLQKLLKDCEEVQKGFVSVGVNQHTHENVYEVDASIAKELLPFMENKGYFFGPSLYNDLYAQSIISMIEIIRSILDTTDFNNQTIYFNASW